MTMTNDRRLGRISYYNNERGFGFILSDEPGMERVFFHITNVIEGQPQTGVLCVFQLGRTAKGVCATNVAVAGGGA